MVLKPGTRVHLLAFVGATFEPSWSEKGIIRKPRVSKGEGVPGPDWYAVEFDAENGGGRLCIHRERIMVANDQRR